jgi:hypothetical protein
LRFVIQSDGFAQDAPITAKPRFGLRPQIETIVDRTLKSLQQGSEVELMPSSQTP